MRLLPIVVAALAACGAPTPAPSPPRAAPTPALAPSPTLAPPPTPDAGAPDAAPPSVAHAIFSVSFVNLSVSHASLEIDSDHHAVFRAQSEMRGLASGDDEPTVIEGTASDAAVAHLLDVVKRARLCSERLPRDEPMVWIDVSVPSEPPCSLRMSPGVWRKRHPDVLRAIHAIEREVCSGPCPRSLTFD